MTASVRMGPTPSPYAEDVRESITARGLYMPIWGIYRVFLQGLMDKLTSKCSEPTSEMCVVGENYRFSAHLRSFAAVSRAIFGRF